MESINTRHGGQPVSIKTHHKKPNQPTVKMNTDTSLATRKTVEELVREWNMATHLLQTGLETLMQAEAHFRAFDGPGSHYDLCLFTSGDYTMDFDRKIKRLKAAAWRYLIDRIELKKMASVKRAGEIDRQINDGTDLPEITMDNLFGWLQSLDGQAKKFLEEAIVEVFEFLRPPSLRYKTNSGFKVGGRVILCGRVEKAWSGTKFRVSYHYENNKAVYAKLRYGVPVKIESGKVTATVKLIRWDKPELNDFLIVEEVTLRGGLERRPDLLLYVNGIAVGVIELKNSYVSIGDGIRQLLSNQSKEFNEWFFTTVQIVFAGNDSEGLKYGTIRTPEKMFLRWKEDEEDDSRYKLDKYLIKMCRKDRLIELMHDFVLFDGGIKKLPRVHQYFGIKKAQKKMLQYIGGIIWHTQGSGKSVVMVLLAKWILENLPKARVLILTDRDELDKQIERVFTDAGEDIYRTSSGKDLMAQLGQAAPRLLSSLVHKFGNKGVKGKKEFDAFIKELNAQPTRAVGELFIFVDECHRTQSGKLHKTMKALLPGAVFIGFTGTPLLKKDKGTSYEVFGDYIHTYKFGEAVEDEVVLDLVYEARDIEQLLGSQDKIDEWFETKTKGLNDWQRAALREQWGTLQKVLSSKSRMDRVIMDIIHDFGVKPRLISHRGNAMLVASSIYEATKYYDLLQKTSFKGKCAVITSYNPQAQDVTKEETGAGTETEKQFLYNTYNELLRNVEAQPGKSQTETYEDNAKNLFIKQPATMRLLIVVDKLLTGFDAPSCTYLYIDKTMQDHGLFQAICRTNRLDGDDKPFGYIVDYKDLFKNLVNEKGTGALQVYSSELDHSEGGTPPDVMIQDRLKKGKERLDQALDQCAMLCDPVEPPKGELEHIHYFCGNVEIPENLKARETQRVALYKSAAALVRAYANIADDMPQAGYSDSDISRIKDDIDRILKLREIIRMASGETIDLKAYEADMRYLIDSYIEAKEPKKISTFDDVGLLEVIAQSGMADAIASMPNGIKGNKNAVAETIANNVRKKIIKEHLNDPAFYDKMSALLKEILDDLKAKRISYEKFLKRIAEQVIKPVQRGAANDTPKQLDTPGKRALYNNLTLPSDGSNATTLNDGDPNLRLARVMQIDSTVKNARQDNWRGNSAKENLIKEALYRVLDYDESELDRIFPIIVAQTEY
jgi:type I restriction enzyme R subunit